MPVTTDDMIRNLISPHTEARASLGLTPLYWAKQLKAESKAKISKTLKVRGAISKSALPRGVKVMAVTGVIVSMDEGARDYSDGESVITWDETDWGTRQRARMDAQKLDNAYPADKIEFPDGTGKPQSIGAAFGDTERSARLIYLLEKAEARAKEAKCK